MKFNDKITIYDEHGDVIVETFNGSLSQRLKRMIGMGCYANDLIVDAGLADVADMIMDRYDYISLGTGTTAPSRTDTALEAECITRVQCTSKVLATTYYTNDTIRFTANFTPASNMSVTESGVHKNATSSGDIMFARETFPARSMLKDVTYPVVWDVIVMR